MCKDVRETNERFPDTQKVKAKAEATGELVQFGRRNYMSDTNSNRPEVWLSLRALVHHVQDLILGFDPQHNDRAQACRRITSVGPLPNKFKSLGSISITVYLFGLFLGDSLSIMYLWLSWNSIYRAGWP